jgi:hypothetical protein
VVTAERDRYTTTNSIVNVAKKEISKLNHVDRAIIRAITERDYKA